MDQYSLILEILKLEKTLGIKTTTLSVNKKETTKI